jgi:hypothetical protein
MQTLTVRDIAERIRRYSEEITPVIDRLRGWTDIGLLKTVEDSDLNPGKGRAREYPEIAIVDAALLTLFAEAGLSPLRSGRMERSDTAPILQLGRQAYKQERRGYAQWLVVWGRPPIRSDWLKYEVEPHEAKIGKLPKVSEEASKEASWMHVFNISVQLKSILTRGEF